MARLNISTGEKEEVCDEVGVVDVVGTDDDDDDDVVGTGSLMIVARYAGLIRKLSKSTCVITL